MSLNDKLLKAAAAGGITPSEHFGVALYEGDGKSGRSINGGKFGAGASFGIEKSTTQATDSRVTTTYYAKNVGSISGWLKKNGNTSELEYVFVTKDDTGSAHQLGINLLQEADSDLSARVGNGSSTTNVNTSGLTLNNDAWHHYVVTWNLPNGSNNVKVYVNGSLEATGSQSTGSWTGNSSRTFQLGHYTNTNTNNGFAGMQDQVRVFEKELSSSEVSTLYAETASTVTSLDPLSEDTTDTLQVLGDSSCVALYKLENNEDDKSSNYNGTGIEVQYAAGRYGQGAIFSDSDSKINIPDNFGAESETVSYSLWFKTTSANGSYMFAKRTGNNTFHIRIDNSFSPAGKICVNNWAGTAQSANNAQSTNGGYNDGGWHHFVFTYDGNETTKTKCFIDGVYDSGMDWTYNLSTQSISGGNNIGNYDLGSSNFSGTIDQVRVFNKTLSASEVTTLYQENSLVASYRFEGNSSDDMRAYDGTDNDVTYEYGLGFTPDFVWCKTRSATGDPNLTDSTRGVQKGLNPNLNSAEGNQAPLGVTSFDTGGFTVADNSGGGASVNGTGQDYVAWCLKANGGTTSSNTDGTITSTVQANTAAGFSIIKYTGTGSNASIGHNLGVAPEMIFIKKTSASSDWVVGALDWTKYLELNGTPAFRTANVWQDTAPTSSVFTLTSGGDVNGNGSNYIAYAFASINGFSKIGSYTGTGSTQNIETGFEVEFLLIKGTSFITDWMLYDKKRSGKNYLIANSNAAEGGPTANPLVTFLSNGFQVHTSNSENKSGETFIYMAFAADPDTEQPTVANSFSTVAYTGNGGTQSIDGLGFQPNLVWIKHRNEANDHVLTDSIRGTGLIYPNGNDAQSQDSQLTSFDSDGFSLAYNTGQNVKFNKSGGAYVAWSWKADDNEPTIEGGAAKAVYKFEDNGNDVTGSYNGTAYNVSYSSSGKFNKAADFSTGGANIAIGSPIPNTDTAVSVSAWIYLNTDATSYETVIGAGSATASSEAPFRVNVRYVSANTYKIEALRQIAGTYYNTALSNYTDSSMAVETWHHIVWTYHPTGRTLTTYLNGSKVDTLSMGSTGSSVNDSTSVIGNFRNDTTADNFSGLIDQVRIYSGTLQDEQVSQLYEETASQNDDLILGGPPETIISANANAGFSIVKFEKKFGSSVAEKIPHGLSAAPEMILLKRTDGAEDWYVYHTSLGNAARVQLNSSAAQTTGTNVWGQTNPTATVFTVESFNAGNAIAYCFHSVSGYSKFGTYTGTNNGSNGSTTSITTGFRPDFVIVKAYTTSDNWRQYDSVTNSILYPNLSNAADGVGNQGHLRFDNNGFTMLSDNSNYIGVGHIYMAFKIN